MESLSKVNSHTEWGKLKEVILGIVDHARVPVVKNKDIHCVDYANYDTVEELPGGYYPEHITELAKDELENFAKI